MELAERGDRVHLKVTGRLKRNECSEPARIRLPDRYARSSLALMAVAERDERGDRNDFSKAGSCMWKELRRMGAEIRVEGNRVVITGREGLTGAPVMASDLGPAPV